MTTRKEQLEQELRQIKEKEYKEGFKSINDALEMWRKKIATYSVPKEQGIFRLNIEPHAQSEHSSLQCMRYMSMGGENSWDYHSYRNNDGGAQPLVFYAKKFEHLLPKYLELLTMYGVEMNITLVNGEVVQLRDMYLKQLQKLRDIVNNCDMLLKWSNSDYTMNELSMDKRVQQQLTQNLTKSLQHFDHQTNNLKAKIEDVDECIELLSTE